MGVAEFLVCIYSEYRNLKAHEADSPVTPIFRYPQRVISLQVEKVSIYLAIRNIFLEMVVTQRMHILYCRTHAPGRWLFPPDSARSYWRCASQWWGNWHVIITQCSLCIFLLVMVRAVMWVGLSVIHFPT